MASACRGVDIGFVGLGYAKVAFLGVVQGITELLPVSSTGHMRVVPALLGWPDPGAAFSAAMQAAALVAVVSYFWRDIVGIVAGSLSAVANRRLGDPNLRLAISIVVATIPIVVAGVLLKPVLNSCNSPLRTLQAIGAAYLLMAVLLGLAERFARHRRTLEMASPIDAILVGLAQMGALIPGVSRSGSTLTAALALGFKRDEAARFSFLLGIPAIAGAGLVEFHELHKAHLDAHGWSVLGVGLACGAVSSFVAIWALLRILERFSAWPFAVYRALLGIFLLVAAATGFLH